VVNCIFAQDSLWQVEVSTTASPGEGELIQILKNAEVSLYESDVRLSDIVLDSVDARSNFIGQGGRGGTVKFYYHRTAFSRGRAGRNYEIRVSYPGFPVVYSTSVIPRAPRVRIVSSSLSNTVDIGDTEHTRLSYNITDESGNNYYGLEIWARETEGDGSLKRLSYYSDDVILLENSVVTQENSTGYSFFSSRSGVFFSNRHFRQQEKGFSSLIPSTTYETASEIYVRVLRLSPELYAFVTSYQRQLINQSNPFAEPAQVYSNIQNGSGIFAGYSMTNVRVK
jgi:hypothetical protein